MTAPHWSDLDANDALRDLGVLRSHHARELCVFDIELARLKRARAELVSAFERAEAARLAELHYFFLANPPAKGKRLQLPAGVLRTHKGRNAIEILNEIEAREWAARHCPAAIKVVESLLKTPILEHFEATGELPPGCEFKPAAEHFYAEESGV